MALHFKTYKKAMTVMAYTDDVVLVASFLASSKVEYKCFSTPYRKSVMNLVEEMKTSNSLIP